MISRLRYSLHFFFFQSGKLVTKMFQRLHEYMLDPDLFVCVLIDEVLNNAFNVFYLGSSVKLHCFFFQFAIEFYVDILLHNSS